MAKLRLAVEDLAVESLQLTPRTRGAGTVLGRDTAAAGTDGVADTCYATCFGKYTCAGPTMCESTCFASSPHMCCTVSQ
jgi:hypothetical protein